MPQKLGQNFLKDTRALLRIASVLDISPTDTVIEIGPGHGELTRRILSENPKNLIAIEKDEVLISKYLNSLIESNKNFRVIHGDALLLLQGISKGVRDYKLVGNIPYYITGHLFRKIEELENKPQTMVFTVQKEVALRLTAGPPKMNLLAATIQFWGKPEIVRYISKKSFRPAPRVDSAIIKIVPYKERMGSAAKQYYKCTKALFNQPRKTVLNNLFGGIGGNKKDLEQKLKNIAIEPNSRPQDLEIEQIKKLSSLFTENK